MAVVDRDVDQGKQRGVARRERRKRRCCDDERRRDRERRQLEQHADCRDSDSSKLVRPGTRIDRDQQHHKHKHSRRDRRTECDNSRGVERARDVRTGEGRREQRRGDSVDVDIECEQQERERIQREPGRWGLEGRRDRSRAWEQCTGDSERRSKL